MVALDALHENLALLAPANPGAEWHPSLLELKPVVDALSLQPSLAAAVLRSANSPAYGAAMAATTSGRVRAMSLDRCRQSVRG